MVSSLRWIATFSLGSALVLASPAHGSTTFSVINNGTTSYRIDGATNPTLSLTRGQTYIFNINAPGNPFWIKTIASTGTGNAYNTGVTNNGIDSGTITFVVPANAPATLHYSCEFHSTMTGTMNVSNPTPVRPQSWGKLKTRYIN